VNALGLVMIAMIAIFWFFIYFLNYPLPEIGVIEHFLDFFGFG